MSALEPSPRLTPGVLRTMPLCQNLSDADLERFGALLHRKNYAAQTNLITAQQPGEVAYIILRGTVKVFVESEDGDEVILAFGGPGEVVGEMSLVDSLGRSATVVTQEPSVLLWIDRAAFWDTLRSTPAMFENLARVLTRRVRMANEQIQALATLDVYGRIARQLLAFAREYVETRPDGSILIPLRLTQDDLADLVGASRVRVNQGIVGWKRRRYISIDDEHRITVHNAKALAQRIH